MAAGGTLVFRNEDLDPQRSRSEFARAMVEDLAWLGIRWQEGPTVDGGAELARMGRIHSRGAEISILRRGGNCWRAGICIHAMLAEGVGAGGECAA